jgi:hypothetical protein
MSFSRQTLVGFVLIAAVIGLGASAGTAATLDTPAIVVVPGSANPVYYCFFTNLHATNTCTLTDVQPLKTLAGTGVTPGVAYIFDPVVPPGGTAVAASVCPNSPPYGNPGCRCHFEFEGCSKGKARGSITADGASLRAY